MNQPTPKPYVEPTALRVVKRIASSPFVLLALAFWLPVRLYRRMHPKPESELRNADALRQSRARRLLRGLPPDHDPESHPTEGMQHADRTAG